MILGFDYFKAERMETINQRISKLVKRVGKQVRFAEACGIRASTLNMIVGKAKVTPDTATIEKILATYPDVSREWLMSGSGPMLKTAIADGVILFEEAADPEKEAQDRYVKAALANLEEALKRIDTNLERTEERKRQIEAAIQQLKGQLG